MPVYFAGTGETNDLLTIIFGLALFFAIVALLSWGIPFMGNIIRRRREARLHHLEETDSMPNEIPEDMRALDMHSLQTH